MYDVAVVYCLDERMALGLELQAATVRATCGSAKQCKFYHDISAIRNRLVPFMNMFEHPEPCKKTIFADTTRGA